MQPALLKKLVLVIFEMAVAQHAKPLGNVHDVMAWV